MHQYIARRFLTAIPVLLGVSIIIFVIMRIVPGDVALAVMGGGEAAATISEEDLAAMRHRLGVDRPYHEQYFAWIGGLLRLDAGMSLWTETPVVDEISQRLPLTIELASLAVILSVCIAIPVGILSAIRQDTWMDYVFRVFTIGGLAVPDFWLGTLVVLFLVLWFSWLPPVGFAGLLDDPWKNVQQMIWPATILGYRFSAVMARMMRSCMLEALRQDYIRTAWSKGLRERAVIFRHALKNAVLPVITIAGNELGYLLGGAVVMETIFSLPGVGRALVDSVFHRDYPVVQVIILMVAMVFVFVNLAVDLLYGWLDPRIRYG